ncbi:MAG TPA: 23S rRNA (guanosine(2251)-2'-O)-methyltransferase RlmB [Kiritimatiellia bacterium]|nr:23S rRNA (guanosine(2251)-2'-O)-methyltransferase RlmB [Kiritimatiellia bacterium]HMO98002.1 23S rRNA (guanosine(2251)-2'-O)-methyltransferase RlmB [Kiritimatiellia bacterium]HMP95353.1 23S rRNA (guanosine(2251)-2'-O)-methyltransferase RlmB [Kiritimatiellia bacterium]
MGKSRWEYIYGINPAFEVLRGGRREVYHAYLNEHAQDNPRLKKLARFLESRGVPVEWVSKQRVFELSESKDHQGVALKTEPYPYAAADTLYNRERLLLLDNTEDPHNTGAIIRCADVFGYHAILAPLKGVPEVYPSVVKVSAGATEHLDIAREGSANHHMLKARETGHVVVALDAAGTTDLRDLAATLPSRHLLVIGGEAKAVSQYILNHADHVARIPQAGKINSLNASVAAGIAMYALARLGSNP